MKKSANEWRTNPKFSLLSTVSALTLTMAGYGPAYAAAEPSVWIELGWQSEHVYDSRDSFALPLGSINFPGGVPGDLAGGLLLSHSYGDNGKITFRPDDTPWVFSASVVYGRSSGKRRGTIDYNHPLPTTSFVTFQSSYPAAHYYRSRIKQARVTATGFHVETVSAESHYMLDFEAGHDVGLGLFGDRSTSTLSAGVRVAQLESSLNIANFRAVPGAHLEHFHFTPYPPFALYINGTTQVWSDFAGNAKSNHDFRGFGPSVRWDASAALWGDAKHGGEISVDWGVNAAILFGKQKNRASHQTIGSNLCYGQFCAATRVPYRATSDTRSEKSVRVPNLGGSIGISYRFEDVKMSIGYRGDFFFRAIDTGIPGEHSITRGFQGPYASVSLGVGD